MRVIMGPLGRRCCSNGSSSGEGRAKRRGARMTLAGGAEFEVTPLPSVTKKLQIASFLFVDGNEPFFGCQFSVTPSTN